MTKTQKTLLKAAALILIAVISFTVIADIASDAARHKNGIASIDEKTQDVLKLTGAAALASAGISAIPGDTATPIADKLADFSQWFLIALCVLYAEKHLLTLMGLVSFRCLIPLACAFALVGLKWKTELMKRIAVKLSVFALLGFFIVPIGIRVSDSVYHAYDDTLQQTVDAAQELSDRTSAISESTGILNVLDQLKETVTSLTNRATEALNRFIQSLAVVIVSSCVIPVLAMLLMIWLVKVITGINIQTGSVVRLLPEPKGPRHDRERREAIPPAGQE